MNTRKKIKKLKISKKRQESMRKILLKKMIK